ncbi:MAG TPA: PKD domain-containing protein [Planctomycetota bacterium]|nr:PKD domain-containing protein [Planctomycetota bacterium]
MPVSEAHAASQSLSTNSRTKPINALIVFLSLLTTAPLFAAALDAVADRVLGQADFASGAINQGGNPSASSLYNPHGICIDLKSGRVYVSDTFNNRILSWPNSATFTNGQAADKVFGQPDFVSVLPNQGAAKPSAGTLNSPEGIRVDSLGNLYVCDSSNHRVLVYDDPATHDTIADRVIGQSDFLSGNPNRGSATASPRSLNFPNGLALDSNNNVWVADSLNNRVIGFTSPLKSGTPFKVIGQPNYSTSTENAGGLSAKSLARPLDVAVDANDNLLIADSYNNRVLMYRDVQNNILDDAADTVYGQPNFISNASNRGGATARNSLALPIGLAVDAAGRVYISDFGNHRVVQPESINNFAGASRVFGQSDFAGNSPNQGGAPSASTLSGPFRLCFDGNNNLYVADYFNNRVLEYDQPFAIPAPSLAGFWPSTTSAGSPSFTLTVRGRGFLATSVVLVNGVPRPTQLISFERLDATIPSSDVSAAGELVITVSTPGAGVSSFKPFPVHARLGRDTAADAVLGQPNFLESSSFADGQSPRSLYFPLDVAVNPTTGRLWVCDTENYRVLSWPNAAAFADGQGADFVLGQPDLYSTGSRSTVDDKTMYPYSVAVDARGNVYVADYENNRVLEFDDPITTDAVADRVFGQPDFTTSTPNTGGLGPASLSSPQDVAVDGDGRLYVADTSNHRVLIYSSPLISNVADGVLGQPGFASNTANNGGVSAKSLSTPYGLGLDASGRLYVADTFNHRVLGYDTPLTIGAAANRVFGQSTFDSNMANAGGISAGSLSRPVAVCVSATGELYISDSRNNRVLEFDHPLDETRAANRVFGQGDSFTVNTDNNGGVSARSLSEPNGVYIDAKGTLFIADSNNNRVLAFDRPVNHAPIIAAGITANPPVPGFANPVNFSVTAADPDADALTFAWDFGDGNTGTGATPSHVYALAGDYVVSVLVTDPFGESASANLTLTVVPLSITSIKADPPAPLTGQTVTFTVGVVGPPGVTSSFLWNFGDGSGSVEPTPKHVYATAGTFTVSVTVTDNAGHSLSTNTSLNVTEAPAISALELTSPISANPAAPGIRETVGFSVGVAGPPGAVLSYLWDFGDGSSSSAAAPTHAYAVAGVFNVTVTVTDDAGHTLNSSMTLTVSGPTPQPLTVSKLQIKLNFVKTGSDTITIAGTLPVPQGFAPGGQQVSVDVGGAVQTFTLSSKGSAKVAKSSFKLQLKKQKGSVNAQNAKFSATLKGAFATSLENEGLVGTITVKNQPVTVLIVVQLDVTPFSKLQPIHYSAKAGKSGSGK